MGSPGIKWYVYPHSVLPPVSSCCCSCLTMRAGCQELAVLEDVMNTFQSCHCISVPVLTVSFAVISESKPEPLVNVPMGTPVFPPLNRLCAWGSTPILPSYSPAWVLHHHFALGLCSNHSQMLPVPALLTTDWRHQLSSLHSQGESLPCFYWCSLRGERQQPF